MARKRAEDDGRFSNLDNLNLNTSKRKPRILFLSAYSSIEPLGQLHLAGLARDLGFDRKRWF